MSQNVDHVLLTRFNLPTEGLEGLIRARDGWLRERVGLFETYCAPSVHRQTCQNFKWIVYFDPDSPGWLHKWISEYAPRRFTPVLRSSVGPENVLADIKSLFGVASSVLVTSNLDNDDALALDFVERVQSAAPQADRTAVYLTHGLIKSGARLYLRRDMCNAFCSVIESWESPLTCWHDWHTLLGRSMKVLQLPGDPAWLQVIHGRNVSNRVRGRLTSGSRYAANFSGLLDDVTPIAFMTYAKDVIVAQPLRMLKDAARLAIKHATMRVVGKEGLHRVHAFSVSCRERLNFLQSAARDSLSRSRDV
jgi:hypothetical protein